MAENQALMMKLGGLFKARFPYVYIPSCEEERVVQMICTVARDPRIIKTGRRVFIWTQTDGWVNEDGTQIKSTTDPLVAIQFI